MILKGFIVYVLKYTKIFFLIKKTIQNGDLVVATVKTLFLTLRG